MADKEREIIVVGGGIAGLYCARELARRGCKVVVLERTNRWGGRIETSDMGPPPFGNDEHKAEFGPMRFELDLQQLFAGLLTEFNLATEDFSPPSAPEPPVLYPLTADERHPADGTPLSSLELLKLGVYSMFGQQTEIIWGKSGAPVVKLAPVGQRWLARLSDDNGSFDRLRQEALMPGTEKPLYQFGFWNALYTQLSPMAVAKILHFGTFYHLMPDNPNAAEWAIFWLRLFKLGDDDLSTIPAGVQTLVEALRAQLDAMPAVTLELEHEVVSLRPIEDDGRIEVEIRDRQARIADHVVLALPKQPLLQLADGFPDERRRDLDAVIAFPLLKVFCVVQTPPWWQTDYPKAQDGAWDAPTREIHYLPAEPDGRGWPPKTTLVLLYTDRPGVSYWQPYLADPDAHFRAELNMNEDLKDALNKVLFGLHWEWAKNLAQRGDRIGRHPFFNAREGRLLAGIQAYWEGVFAELDPDSPELQTLAITYPALVGHPAQILFRSQAFLQDQKKGIGDYAIRDWSRPPFGAGCHAWAPGARSWEVLRDLAAFGFAGSEGHKNLHVCGESYSDYQGFIEGALRSARNVIHAIAGP